MAGEERQDRFPAPLTRLTKQIILQLLENFPIFLGCDFLPISPQPHVKRVCGGIQKHHTERFSASAWQLTFNQRICPLFRRNLAEAYDTCRHYQLAYRFLAQQCEASRHGKLKKGARFVLRGLKATAFQRAWKPTGRFPRRARDSHSILSALARARSPNLQPL